MRRVLLSTSLIGLALSVATSAAATSLTRIETRPFYGATVTLEEGVRVFRPLPPHRHIIINPDGQTPLNLTIEDRNVVVHHHYSAEQTDGAGRFASGSAPGVYSTRGYRRGHHGRHLIHVPSRRPGGVRVK